MLSWYELIARSSIRASIAENAETLDKVLSHVGFVLGGVSPGFDTELCRVTGIILLSVCPCNYNSRSWYSSLFPAVSRTTWNQQVNTEALSRGSAPPRKPCPPLGHSPAKSAPLSHFFSQYYREQKPKALRAWLLKMFNQHAKRPAMIQSKMIEVTL
jgi:hypothetical protein